MEIKINDQFISKIWTKETCQIEALKYNNKKEFRENSQYSYKYARKNNWLDDICSHMNNKKYNFWNKEQCHKEALKYNTRLEYQKKSASSYSSALKNKWIDEICLHMIPIGNKYKRCIYAFEFNDNSVYIGLTYNLNKRKIEHLTNENSSVFKHIQLTNSDYKLIQLTDYINNDEAIKLEQSYIENYTNNNWNILNISKGGSLGYFKSKEWTKEDCLQIALQYNSKKDFYTNHSNIYFISRKNKWLDDICNHM